MQRLIILLLTSLFTQVIHSQTILMECGQNSGHNFNSWFVHPYPVFDDIEFDEYSTAFFSEFGGNYSVSMTRKIEEMQSYKLLNLLFNFDVIHNCVIESVVYYTSTDGKKWIPINSSRNNVAVNVSNDSLDISYVRATATVNFSENGKLSCNYAKVEGDLKVESALATIPETNPDEAEFYIFSFEHTLNIETQIDRPYEILITAISGQIVYREKLEGSNRIDLPSDMQGIFVISIIQDNAFQASKKVVI